MKMLALTAIRPDLDVRNDAEFNALGMATTKFHNEQVLAFLGNLKFLDDVLNNPNIVGIITTGEIYNSGLIPKHYGVALSDNPKRLFYEIHNALTDNHFYWQPFENKIAKSAVIASGAHIAAHSVEIGENSVIEPGVVVHSGTIIGNHVVIRSGSQIGTCGFQFVNIGDEVVAAKTGGRLIIKDHVEIQHNTCVDRGVLGGDTVLNEYVKIDNLVYIAHDVIAGKRTLIAAGACVSGRTVLGDDCWVGINATLTNGITVGNKSKITLGAVVTKNVPENTTVSGNFAIEHSKFIDFMRGIR